MNNMAINILKNNQTKNINIKRKKNIAAWDLNYLMLLLNF
ncbi:hypothetical protein FM107_00935 [Sphingobacterium sp. JB170]|nr:hypothetical protein FM107_00935 [Sphingobacterium sp. JB170]